VAVVVLVMVAVCCNAEVLCASSAAALHQNFVAAFQLVIYASE